MEKIYIYALSDPISKEIRYIGKTKNLNKRLRSHIDYAKNKNRKRRYVSDWILGLLKNNLKPIVILIEETTLEIWSEREKYWIKHFKSLQFNLCNLTDGGESNTGYVYSDDLKEVRRKARIGYKTPKEVKEKISKTLSKQIKCITDDIVFKSMKDAIKYSNIPKSTFHRKLHKKELINEKEYTFV